MWAFMSWVERNYRASICLKAGLFTTLVLKERLGGRGGDKNCRQNTCEEAAGQSWNLWHPTGLGPEVYTPALILGTPPYACLKVREQGVSLVGSTRFSHPGRRAVQRTEHRPRDDVIQHPLKLYHKYGCSHYGLVEQHQTLNEWVI